MSNCSNCYNNCTEITSDKCVKYTGVDVPVLGISKGDSLSFVEQALITFLTSTLNGSGIKIEISEDDYCELVSQYLQECETVTALDLFTALVKAACSLQTQLTATNANVTALNPGYTIECLTGVNGSSTTPAIVQAIIGKLCSTSVLLDALVIDVDTNYVKVAELNALVAAYIDSTLDASKFYTKMVPYSIIPYYGTLSAFDGTGAGTGDWEQIYICNGANSTPDLRGRGLVGTVNGISGGTLAPAVDPVNPANPDYSLGMAHGANEVTLSAAQLPAHTHGVTDPGHLHTTTAGVTISATSAGATVYFTTGGTPVTQTSNSQVTGISINSTGGGSAHENIQPVRAVHFIMHIPD